MIEPASKKRAIRKRTPVRRKPRLRAIRLGEGLPSLPQMHAELQDMVDVLMGRTEPAIDFGIMSLMEYADAFGARAAEMTMQLQALERNGQISKGSNHYKFRTGELRTFMEMAYKAAALGSRRITKAQLQAEAEKTGRQHRVFGNDYDDD